MLRAPAYIAKIIEASVGAYPAGSIDCGLTSPAIENPPATKTLIAVTSEAMRIGPDREEGGMRKSPCDRHHAAGLRRWPVMPANRLRRRRSEHGKLRPAFAPWSHLGSNEADGREQTRP